MQHPQTKPRKLTGRFAAPRAMCQRVAVDDGAGHWLAAVNWVCRALRLGRLTPISVSLTITKSPTGGCVPIVAWICSIITSGRGAAGRPECHDPTAAASRSVRLPPNCRALTKSLSTESWALPDMADMGNRGKRDSVPWSRSDG